MVEEIDIWRSAEIMRKQYGQNAGYQAGLKAGELLKAGDRDGFDTWKRIFRAIQELDISAPPNAKPSH